VKKNLLFTPPKFDSQISHISKKMDIFNERKYFFWCRGCGSIGSAQGASKKRMHGEPYRYAKDGKVEAVRN